MKEVTLFSPDELQNSRRSPGEFYEAVSLKKQLKKPKTQTFMPLQAATAHSRAQGTGALVAHFQSWLG